MNGAADPLAALRDIHLPLEPGLWPPAPGWWILVAIFLLLGWLLVNNLIKYFRRIQPSREFRNQLGALNTQGGDEHDLRTVQKISKLVRQYAIYRFGRDQVASLHGDKWLKFLDTTSKGGNEFTTGVGRVLGDAQYRPHIEPNLDQLTKFLISWSKHS